MRVARLSEKGIMVDTEKLHELGPVNGALAMVAGLLDMETKEYAMNFEIENENLIHHFVEPANDEPYLLCGEKPEGDCTIWNLKDKKITCKKCIVGDKKWK